MLDELLKKYIIVGIINTLISWSLFYLFFILLHQSQSISNLLSFLFSVSISYILNSSYTFKQKKELKKYICYVCFMGFISYGVGYIFELLKLPSILTLICFTCISFVAGFLFSKKVTFKECKE